MAMPMDDHHNPDRATGVRLSRTLPARPDSPGAARDFARGACRMWRLEPTGELFLVVSELATNAVRYGGAQFMITLELSTHSLRVSVEDLTDAPPVVASTTNGQPGGRGLRIVTLLAGGWGWEPSAYGGKRVWAELMLP